MKSIRISTFCCVTSIVMLAMGQALAAAPATAKIAFASSLNVKAKGDSDIYIMNPDGTGRVNLTRHNAKDSEPTWSPSGSNLAPLTENSFGYCASISAIVLGSISVNTRSFGERSCQSAATSTPKISSCELNHACGVKSAVLGVSISGLSAQ
ncbi:hypothetical protein F4054_01010 [Candidatus Poribacteria bacterium]|nr:hypothetical protein [Candidatus Poribacteria bacterium]MYG07716.1 hypothetical protein [Candidatus Poribacteria bacterium]MYK20820.1 hypothetical protein [Candidatus Poribacteria bacterium]